MTMHNANQLALTCYDVNDADAVHDARVAYAMMHPSDREEQLRNQVRFLPEMDCPRLRNNYFTHIESLRLRDDGSPPIKVGSDFPPWVTTAKVAMLWFGFAYCGYRGIWSVAKHIEIDDQPLAAAIVPWVLGHETFERATNEVKGRFPNNFALTSKERDEQLLDNLYNRIQSEKNPREYRALVKLFRDAKRDYDKNWKR
jgi:hypothetical protein